MEYSNTKDDFYDNIKNDNPNRSHKILIVFDDMIGGINTNKKFQSTVKELFIRSRKLEISLAFITQFLFSCFKRCQIKLYTLPYNKDSK